jgi:hypothetical protein
MGCSINRALLKSNPTLAVTKPKGGRLKFAAIYV